MKFSMNFGTMPPKNHGCIKVVISFKRNSGLDIYNVDGEFEVRYSDKIKNYVENIKIGIDTTYDSDNEQDLERINHLFEDKILFIQELRKAYSNFKKEEEHYKTDFFKEIKAIFE
jgi:hypothetical protein